MTLRELISYLMEKGQVLSVSSQRQRDELMELIISEGGWINMSIIASELSARSKHESCPFKMSESPNN